MSACAGACAPDCSTARHATRRIAGHPSHRLVAHLQSRQKQKLLGGACLPVGPHSSTTPAAFTVESLQGTQCFRTLSSKNLPLQILQLTAHLLSNLVARSLSPLTRKLSYHSAGEVTAYSHASLAPPQSSPITSNSPQLPSIAPPMRRSSRSGHFTALMTMTWAVHTHTHIHTACTRAHSCLLMSM